MAPPQFQGTFFEYGTCAIQHELQPARASQASYAFRTFGLLPRDLVFNVRWWSWRSFFSCPPLSPPDLPVWRLFIATTVATAIANYEYYDYSYC
eukprot:8313802-Pyramimonas_sp.AAC.1